ncbi:MAG: hypothetical protein ACTSQZ_05780, partial [Candidatus Thorarchaeota archaeon]
MYVVIAFSELNTIETIHGISEQLRASHAIIVSIADFEELVQKNDELLNQQICFFFGSGGTENVITEFISNNKLTMQPILLSYESNNSLPSAMESNAFLRRSGIKTRHVHSKFEELVSTLNEWVEFEQIIEKLKNSRLGSVGGSSSWLVASAVDFDSVSQRWGLTIPQFPIEEIIRVDEKLVSEYESLLAEYSTEAKKINITTDELEKAGLIYQAVDRLARNNQLDAITIKCFALLEQTDITSCLALSILNNSETFSAGCEGDIPSTFTMMIAKYLTGQSAFMANVPDVNIEDNTIVMAHCTVPTNLVESYEITSHFESGKSVAPEGRFQM